jgi:leucine-rich PPR motif-containing protein
MAAAGVAPSCVTFTTLIDGYVRAGDMAAARRKFVAMRAAGQAPNALTYNSLLRGYASEAATAAAAADGGGQRDVAAVLAAQSSGAGPQGALSEALGLLRDMSAAGVAPTTDTFNTLMAAAVAAGEPRLALELGTRLRGAGLRPDALTYTTQIQAHGRLGQVGEAMATFQALVRDRSAAADLAAYSAAVDALARNGDMAAAERMLEAAQAMADKQGEAGEGGLWWGGRVLAPGIA